MHLLVPFAAADSEPARQVLANLQLPHLARVLARCRETARDDGPAASYSPPQERALASAWQWHGADGALPLAARAAAADGIEVAGTAWGLVTPCHWLLGRDHVVMGDPAALDLRADESRELFASIAPLFESDGFAFRFGAPDRWYAGRDDLEGFATASLDRVVHRDIEAWIGHDADRRIETRRTLQRLQSEAQLVFHSHAVNDARDAAGRPAVNSFWLSGCGRSQPADPNAAPRIVDDLRGPLLAGDWAAWAEAWRAVDAGAVRAFGAACQTTTNATPATNASLTLCGERSASRWSPLPRSTWQRLRAAWQGAIAPSAMLATL